MNRLLEVKGLKKYFKVSRGFLHAVDGVSFTIDEGKTLGVVGESGCGKSTLGRLILGLLDVSEGQIIFSNNDITNVNKDTRFALRKEMQIIFQDPFSSLNPRMCIQDIIAEPLAIYGVCPTKKEMDQRVFEIMDTVGLARRLANTFPHELDGGRRQRIGVGRALALNPRFIVCDEPVSALDVSIQAQILNLMQDLQEEKGLTYLFITHDLSVVKQISDEIMVMYLGCTVERSSANDLFERRLHPYTKGLISAIPVPSTKRKTEKILLTGELSSPINPKPGCRFFSRCAYAKHECDTVTPLLKETLPGHFVACHYTAEINNL